MSEAAYPYKAKDSGFNVCNFEASESVAQRLTTPVSVVCLTARSPSRRLLLMLDPSQLELMLPTDPSSCTTLVSTRSPHAAPSSLTTVFLLLDTVSMTEPQ